MNKKEQRNLIAKFMEIGNSRFKDTESNTLCEAINNRNLYNGKTKTIRNSFTSFSSDGKYTREESTTYTFCGKNDEVEIKKHYEYHDDDGQEGQQETILKGAREILNVLKLMNS